MEDKLLFKGATIIKGTGENPIKNGGLFINGNIIEKIEKLENIKVEKDVKVIDVSGKTIMPGMINTHVHVTMEPVGNPFLLLAENSPVRTTISGIKNLKKHLKAGFTYLRDVGSHNFIDVELKKCLAEGLIEGPGLLVSGHMLTMTGGQACRIGRECDGIDETRKAAREQLKAGADFIKVMATGGVLSPGVSPKSCQMNKEEMQAAIEEAHKAGKKACAHAQGTPGIKNAVLAGIDSIEHGIFLDNEVIELMIERGVYLVGTLVAPHFIIEYGIEGGVPKFAVEKAKRIVDSHLESFRKAYEAGVKIAMGTDSGTSFNYHDKSAYELKLMVDTGMSPMDVIVAATKTGAELLGINDKYGTLENGKVADFIILNENPIDNIETLMNVEDVYKNGKLV